MDIHSNTIDNCDPEVINIVEYILGFCGGPTSFKDYSRNIKIIISDETKIKRYKGKYTDEKITEIIDSTNFKNKRAEDLASGLRRELSRHPKERNEATIVELLDALKRLLESEDISPFDRNKIRRIVEAFEDRDFETVLLGSYKDRKITLYRNPIIDTEKYGNVENNLKRVLTHEMFHAYHHYLFDGGRCRFTRFSRKGTAEIVKEGLADFVEYNYCKDELNPKYCRDLENTWDNHFFENYPYSAAKYIEDYSNKDGLRSNKTTIAKRLINDSLYDFTDAYHDIVYLYKLYENFDKVLANDKNSHYRNTAYSGYSDDLKNYLCFAIATNDVRKTLAKDKSEFKDALMKMLIKKKMNSADCWKSARIDKSAFSKLLKGATNPSRETVSLLGIAFKLNTEEFDEFISYAGWSRSHNEKDPINIVGVFIDNEEYNLHEIELVYNEITGKSLAYYSDRTSMVDLEE